MKIIVYPLAKAGNFPLNETHAAMRCKHTWITGIRKSVRQKTLATHLSILCPNHDSQQHQELYVEQEAAAGGPFSEPTAHWHRLHWSSAMCSVCSWCSTNACNFVMHMWTQQSGYMLTRKLPLLVIVLLCREWKLWYFEGDPAPRLMRIRRVAKDF